MDQSYTGERAAGVSRAYGIEWNVVKLPEAEKGLVPPRRWVVERSFS